MIACAKKTLVTQKITNCVTEIMFEESFVIPPVANWEPGINSMNDPTCERSLMGVKTSKIGTDIGGSVRIPAHFCGVWTLRASTGRFPMWGSGSSLVGLEGLLIVTSPLAGNLEDLHEFSKRVILAKPWQYDHTCVPLPWQYVNLRGEGMIPPAPACKRALKQSNCVTLLVFISISLIQPPNIWEGLKIGYQLLFYDGARLHAGVLPVTFVDKTVDDLPQGFIHSQVYKSYNAVAKTAYSVYNVEKMHGLPLGVQVVGRRLEEEKVLEGIQVIETALRE
ncbi:amidase signature enzyme [Phlegmacium glaucopus]|nr:amidase signature enzyme [Phlegmacium glaucopus]